MKHVLGFSGGIDSQACARWLLNRYQPEDVVLLNSDAGGNEHPLTAEFIARYSAEVHPVVMISATVADMGNRAKQKIADLGLNPTDQLTFPLLAKLKGTWPSRKAQFCTAHLKLYPQHRWMKEHLAGEEWTRYSGVRRQESQNRKDRQPMEWDDYFNCPLHHPIVDWTKQMVFDFVRHHGEPINELYTLGFNRVGCAPCINANKRDVLAWHQRFPEMIDKIRDWEKQTGRTFFAPTVPGLAINWIDQVVDWAKTVRGGKQYSLLVLEDPPSCDSDYGLCE